MKTTGQGTSRTRGHAASNRIAADAHRAVNRMAEAADDRIDNLAGYAHSAVDRAAGAIKPTASWLNAQARGVKARQERLIDDARRAIVDNPFTAVGIAAAAGYVLSRILRR